MARTPIQIQAVNLIELGCGKSGSQFQTSYKCKLLTGSSITKAECCRWILKSRLLRHAGSRKTFLLLWLFILMDLDNFYELKKVVSITNKCDP